MKEPEAASSSHEPAGAEGASSRLRVLMSLLAWTRPRVLMSLLAGSLAVRGPRAVDPYLDLDDLKAAGAEGQRIADLQTSDLQAASYLQAASEAPVAPLFLEVHFNNIMWLIPPFQQHQASSG